MGKLPTLDQIEEWTRAHPDLASRRDIMQAFDLLSSDKSALIGLMKQIKAREAAEKTNYHPGLITGVTDDGELIASYMQGEAQITLSADGSIGIGDEVLLYIDDDAARIVRKIERERESFLARYEETRDGGMLVTINKGKNFEMFIEHSPQKLRDGDLVVAEKTAAKRSKKSKRNFIDYARVISVMGNVHDAHILSQIAIHDYELSVKFSDEVMAEAKAAVPITVPREDLTDLPFVTIDPHDARDHDDAVYVEPWGDGYRLYVAIADVAAFVRESGSLDAEALARGNSVYFPDRVIPMLPDHLSGDLCSLHEGVVRPVLFVAMDINTNGQKQSHRFGRGNILSHGSLSYETAQAVEDGKSAEVTPQISDQLKLLFTCYRAMAHATHVRGSLHLDLPEHKISLNPDGSIDNIGERERLDAHKLVEEAMVMANVCAAQSLEQAKSNLLYRIHEPPKPEKIEVLRLIAKTAGHKMNKASSVTTAAINSLLDHAAGHEKGEAISMQVLRSLRQARYSPENHGHFGLALKRYAHFTSPIRRYADLVVHRALISALGLGSDGLQYDFEDLSQAADHISTRERTAMQAERDTNDRYVAKFMEQYLHTEIEGRISGLSNFGLFITLSGSHADGFAPLRMISDDHYYFDRAKDIIRGKRLGRTFKVGQDVVVKIYETNALSGGVELQLVSHEGKPVGEPARRKRAPKPSRKKRGRS